MLSALRSFIIYRISAINNDTREDEDSEFLIIFASGKERTTASSELHPNFDLSSSFRIDDTHSVRFLTSTPGAPNGAGFDRKVEDTLRAASFKVGLLPTNVDTHTSLFLADVIPRSDQAARRTDTVRQRHRRCRHGSRGPSIIRLTVT